MGQIELQQSVARLVPQSHSLSAGSVAPDQICGKLARLLSAATVVLAAGTWKIDFSSSGG